MANAKEMTIGIPRKGGGAVGLPVTFNPLGAKTKRALLGRAMVEAVRAGRKFADADLRNMDCSGLLFDVGELTASSANRASFSESGLMFMDMWGTSFKNADFRDARIEHSRFSHADLSGANFREASAIGVTFNQVTLKGASFYKASLQRAIFYNTSFADADITYATFDGASFERTNFAGARLLGEEVFRLAARACRAPCLVPAQKWREDEYFAWRMKDKRLLIHGGYMLGTAAEHRAAQAGNTDKTQVKDTLRLLSYLEDCAK